MKLTVDPSAADPLFVYYSVSSKEACAKIIRDSEATGVPKKNLAYLRSFPVRLPPLAEQREIAGILGADRTQSAPEQTLEALVREIFNSCFGAFDPVREGLPEGWSVEKLGTVVSSPMARP